VIRLDQQQAGPAVARMLVGAQLRRLREASGVSREDAGYAIRASASKISRVELGQTGFKRRDVTDLLALYGVADEAECATLLALAAQANTTGWWRAYGEAVPTWFEHYLSLEQAADIIRSYEVQFIPGLLQTEDYARAVMCLGPDAGPESQLERRVSLRMNRQRLLRRPGPPRLWMVIDEAALRRPIGGPATMRAQIRHLLEVAALPGITVQVLPFSAGGHAATGGPITLLRFPQQELSDVVYLEQLASAVYPGKPAEIQHYWNVLNQVATDAEPPAATTGILRRILEQT
jgi:transcriptional regulator with XRE-family HTH domain